MSVEETLKQPDVAAPKNAQIGDEATGEVREATVHVDNDAVKAQVTGPPAQAVKEVYVHETSVALDEVITDPASPKAVQIPDAGRGFLDLPIHQLDQPSPEAVFASEAAKVEEADNGEPKNPAV